MRRWCNAYVGAGTTLAPREVVLLRKVAQNDEVVKKFLVTAKAGRKIDIAAAVILALSGLTFVAGYAFVIIFAFIRSENFLMAAALSLIGVSALLALSAYLIRRKIRSYLVAASAMLVALHLRWTIDGGGDWRHRQRAIFHLGFLGQRFKSFYPVIGVPLIQGQLRESQRVILTHGARVIDSYANDILMGNCTTLSAAREDMARIFFRCIVDHPHEVAHLRPWVPRPAGVGLRALLRQVRWGSFVAPVIVLVGGVLAAFIGAGNS